MNNIFNNNFEKDIRVNNLIILYLYFITRRCGSLTTRGLSFNLQKSIMSHGTCRKGLAASLGTHKSNYSRPDETTSLSLFPGHPRANDILSQSRKGLNSKKSNLQTKHEGQRDHFSCYYNSKVLTTRRNTKQHHQGYLEWYKEHVVAKRNKREISESRSPVSSVRLTVARNEWPVVIAAPKRSTFVIFKPVARAKSGEGKESREPRAEPGSDGIAEYSVGKGPEGERDQ